jgi:hypothetical protein
MRMVRMVMVDPSHTSLPVVCSCIVGSYAFFTPTPPLPTLASPAAKFDDEA